MATTTPAPSIPTSSSTSPPDAPVKPGWKTSEFWLKLLATGLGAAFVSGAIPATGTASIVAFIVAAELGSLGYAVLRTSAKA